jgi:uncharacterized membrane protein YraQ (UPF0718 family)
MSVNQKGKKKEQKKTLYYGLGFLVIVIIFYLVLAIFDLDKISMSLHVSFNILIQILPILVVVILLMGVVNYILKPKLVSKYLGIESGFKGWFLAISMGILSHGPIYVWYPLLKDLQNQGMRTGLVAVFLYNRAIKIPLLPVMIFYFGLEFVILLSIYMMIASIVEGKFIEIIEHKYGV